MKKRRTIPTIIGLVIVIFGIVLGVVATQFRTIFKIGASSDLSPQGVRITNITDTSFTVSWVTARPSTGALEWGQSQLLGQTALDTSTELVETHSVTVSNLAPNTVYYFKIRSGGETFDNNGLIWQLTTGPTLASSTSTNVFSGTVVDSSQQPVKNALVYVTSSATAPVSVRTSTNGTWVLPMGITRTPDNSQYAQIASSTEFTIFVQAGSTGIATAMSNLQNSNPTPTIVIGQTHDFRSQENINIDHNNPNSPQDLLGLPNEEPDNSPGGFNLEDDPIPTSDTVPVTLESVEQGELITSTRPQFFGVAPAGKQITILVESDPISAQITVPQSGNWQWTPPTNLPPGEHTITLRWTDAQGILRTLVRSFTVSAADGPSFETTPSANTTPSPQPLSTLAPTPKPSSMPTLSPTATAMASSSPRVSIPATNSGTPVAGSLTPTLALSIMGLALVMASAFALFKSA